VITTVKWRNIYWHGPGDSIAETHLFNTKEEALADSCKGFLEYRDTIAVNVEIPMFGVGKKYILRSSAAQSPSTMVSAMKCVWANESNACLVNLAGAATIHYAEDFPRYTEYKEPRKFVRYFNVYPAYNVMPHLSREEADRCASPDRIGCKRIEFIEGEYDG
jgi:hypothetical protein